MNVLYNGLKHHGINYWEFLSVYEPMFRGLKSVEDDDLKYEAMAEMVSDRMVTLAIGVGMDPDDVAYIDSELSRMVDESENPLIVPIWGSHELGTVFKDGSVFTFYPNGNGDESDEIVTVGIESLRSLIGTYYGCRNPQKCIELVPYGAFGVYYVDPDKDESEFVCYRNYFDEADNEAMTRTHFMTSEERDADCWYYAAPTFAI